jgi:hypothetical protein
MGLDTKIVRQPVGQIRQQCSPEFAKVMDWKITVRVTIDSRQTSAEALN